jgi:hypothetical protein
MITLNSKIENLIKSELKFSLHYCLKVVNHSKYFYTHVESYTKNELRILLTNELINDGIVNIEVCNKLKTFRDLIEEHFNTKQVIEFKSTQNLSLQNSFNTIKKESNVKLNCILGINSIDYGYFEIYDELTRGDKWYAEGGLWFDNMELSDYDGVFALPICIENKLKELGYKINE